MGAALLQWHVDVHTYNGPLYRCGCRMYVEGHTAWPMAGPGAMAVAHRNLQLTHELLPWPRPQGWVLRCALSMDVIIWGCIPSKSPVVLLWTLADEENGRLKFRGSLSRHIFTADETLLVFWAIHLKILNKNGKFLWFPQGSREVFPSIWPEWTFWQNSALLRGNEMIIFCASSSPAPRFPLSAACH